MWTGCGVWLVGSERRRRDAAVVDCGSVVAWWWLSRFVLNIVYMLYMLAERRSRRLPNRAAADP